MIAWVHSFRKWTWFTFLIGVAAAGCGLASGDNNRICVGSGLAAMIGVALLIGARRWRNRQRQSPDSVDDSVDRGDTDRQEDSSVSNESLPKAIEGSPECRVREFVDSIMSQGRYALLLRPQIAGNLSPQLLALARQRLERQMTLVPEGDVLLEPHLVSEEFFSDAEATAAQGTVVHVDAGFLDRYTVTNRQFQVFVTAGGYDQIAIWDPTVWPAVLDFVDGTGHPGPRYWQHGRFPPGKADHPVVGVSWYEATAYARWIGKRLPTDAEWLKAGCWPVQLSSASRMQRKFPWGNAMDRSRANLWGSGIGDTAPVGDFGAGVSVGGISQLIGNVWEWTGADFELPTPAVNRHDTNRPNANRHDANDPSATDHADNRGAASARNPLKAIRGGAFDTYFDHQACCQFASGESPLARKYNIGFRLALGMCDLVPLQEAELEDELRQSDEATAELQPV